MTKKEQAGSKSIAVNIQDARNAWGDDTKKFIGREKSLSNKIKTSDRLNYFFTSGHADALFLEQTDRRYFVQEKHIYDGGDRC